MRFPTTPFALFFLMASVAAYYTTLLLDDPIKPSFAAIPAISPASLIGDVATLGTSPGDSQTTETASSTPQDASLGTAASGAKPAELTQLSGEATIAHDGTITVQGTQVRLLGIVVAPSEPGADSEATKTLKALTARSDVHCTASPGTAPGIHDGTCWILAAGHPIDLAAEVVLAGAARECASESGGRYLVFKQMSADHIEVPAHCGTAPAPAAPAAPEAEASLKPAQP